MAHMPNPDGAILKIAEDAGGCDDNSDASEDGRMGIEGDAGGGDGSYGDGSGGVGGNASEHKKKKKKRSSRPVLPNARRTFRESSILKGLCSMTNLG